MIQVCGSNRRRSTSNSSNKNNNNTMRIGTKMILVRLVFALLVLAICTTKDTCLAYAYVTIPSSTSSSLSLAFVNNKKVAVNNPPTSITRIFSSITSPASSRQPTTSILSKSNQRQIVTTPLPSAISKAPTSSKRVVAVQTPITSIEQFQQFVTTSKQSASASASIPPPRYTVIKFYATWCKTCAKFNLKYDKLVAKHSDWIVLDTNENENENNQSLHRIGTLQFGTVEYSKCRTIFTTLNVTTLPTIHIYDPYGTKVIDISVPPSKFDQIITIINSFITVSTSTTSNTNTNANDVENKEHVKLGNEYQSQQEHQARLQVPLKQESILEEHEQQRNQQLDMKDTVQHSVDDNDNDNNKNKKSYDDNDNEINNNSDDVDEELFHHYTDTLVDDEYNVQKKDIDECQLELEVDTTISHQAALDVSYHSRSFDECQMLQQQYEIQQVLQQHEATYNQEEQQLVQQDHQQQQRRPSWWRQIPKVVRIVWTKTKTITSNRL